MISPIKILLFSLLLVSISAMQAQNQLPWQGTWSSDFGELRFQQSGNKVYGDYANVGTLEGYLSGNILKGTFDNKGKKGRFEFSLSADRKRLSGKWAWGTATPSGAWNATRLSSDKPILLWGANRTTSLRYRLTLDNIWVASVDDGPEGIFAGYELFGIGWCRAYNSAGAQIQPMDVSYSDKYGRFWEVLPKNYIKTDISTRPYLINQAITFDFPIQTRGSYEQTLDQLLSNSKLELTIELKDYDTASSTDLLGKERVVIPLKEALVPKYTGNAAPARNQGFGFLHITHGKGHLIVTYHIERV